MVEISAKFSNGGDLTGVFQRWRSHRSISTVEISPKYSNGGDLAEVFKC
jgi:hypothetical protein